MPRVVNVLLSKKRGGLERAFTNLCNSQLHLGYEVEAWIPANAPYRKELLKGVKVSNFSSRGFYDFFAMLLARSRIKRTKPDLVITHNSRATSLLARSCWRLPCPVLGFSHSNKIKRMKGADSLVVLTENMRQLFLKSEFDPNRVFIFPNMINYVPPLPASISHSNDLVFVRLGFLGRLNPEKGLDLLLEALMLLRQRGGQLRLHIAGSGDSEAEIRELAETLGVSESVVFDGWIDDIAGWLAEIDLAVLPSRQESFGIAVLEAAAYGCPIVSTTADGPASQITHDIDGWLAEAGSVESLSETLQHAIDSYPRWPDVIRKAHERACRYSMDALLPQLQQLLERAVREGRR